MDEHYEPADREFRKALEEDDEGPEDHEWVGSLFARKSTPDPLPRHVFEGFRSARFLKDGSK